MIVTRIRNRGRQLKSVAARRKRLVAARRRKKVRCATANFVRHFRLPIWERNHHSYRAAICLDQAAMRQVLTFRTRARRSLTVPLYRMPPGQDVGTRQTNFGDALSPDFDIVVNPFFDTSSAVRLCSSSNTTPDARFRLFLKPHHQDS
jgi:hypothetical protein